MIGVINRCRQGAKSLKIPSRLKLSIGGVELSLGFFIKVVLISSTGALAPGPLTAATATVGARHGWKGGLLIGVGHMIVEFPLILLIGLGVASILTSEKFAVTLSFIGGVFLLSFAYLTARDAIKVKSIQPSKTNSSPLLIGISLSALNPFFIAWWVGIGTPLIFEAIGYWGLVGIVAFYLAHVWLDFAWLTLLARLTSFGALNLRIYKSLLLTLAVLVALFGLDFIHYGLTQKHLLSL